MWYSMDEPWEYYTKSKKPDTKGHISYDSFLMKCPEQADPKRDKVD